MIVNDMFGNDLTVCKDFDKLEKYQSMLNKSIMKTSRKPFKSGDKIGIPFAIVKHPEVCELAFMMSADDTYVSCKQCHLVTENGPSN